MEVSERTRPAPCGIRTRTVEALGGIERHESPKTAFRNRPPAAPRSKRTIELDHEITRPTIGPRQGERR